MTTKHTLNDAEHITEIYTAKVFVFSSFQVGFFFNVTDMWLVSKLVRRSRDSVYILAYGSSNQKGMEGGNHCLSKMFFSCLNEESG